MARSLVVHRDRVPESQKIYRAAQYVRMSTDYQQYSIENQAVAIAAYAELHRLRIVRTYRDEGESGLKIENRTGLSALLVAASDAGVLPKGSGKSNPSLSPPELAHLNR
ncbi:recombinase family protein [Bradyrhizobium pachyrhizi]|uniref:recombinase family protein n=1 Tax=Bradyrhizobium pachyrhizi TaxID=280333 RepID=UPI0009E1FBD7|nr:recombinase family protein [Bradyrhizobium pachyrhizi]